MPEVIQSLVVQICHKRLNHPKFQNLTQVETFGQILDRELGDIGSTSGNDRDQALRSQPIDCLIDRCAADAKLSLQTIQIQLDKTRLRAPYDGTIADRFIHEGTVVNPGTPVVRFIESAGREANIGVAVSRSDSLVPGNTYTLTLRDRSFPSTLLTVRPDVDPVTRVMTAVFSIPAEILAVDGEPVSLALTQSVAARGGWLPIAALLEGNRGLWTVLRIERNGGATTVREAVEVLEIRGGRAFVYGTLADGSEVVASGVHRITPGTPVAVAGDN